MRTNSAQLVLKLETIKRQWNKITQVFGTSFGSKKTNKINGLTQLKVRFGNTDS